MAQTRPLGKHQTLADIADPAHAPDGRRRQHYLSHMQGDRRASADSDGLIDRNVEAVARRLRLMGLGSKFEFVGKGEKALVITPAFIKEVVIRLSTEEQEPGLQEGGPERTLRPPSWRVLQAIHTDYVDVRDPKYGRPTRMRIEVLPRLKTARQNVRGEWVARIINAQLLAEGYHIGDLKPDNLGWEPNTRKWVLMDPGEITHRDEVAILDSALRSWEKTFGRISQEDIVARQTSGLKHDWKAHIESSLEKNLANPDQEPKDPKVLPSRHRGDRPHHGGISHQAHLNSRPDRPREVR